jgi:hypothetical protein
MHSRSRPSCGAEPSPWLPRLLFRFNQSAQRFLLKVVPLRHPDSHDALLEFCAQVPADPPEQVILDGSLHRLLWRFGVAAGVQEEVLVKRYTGRVNDFETTGFRI